VNDFSALTNQEDNSTEEKSEEPKRPTDQEVEDKRQAELAAEREEHLRRTNGESNS
jgi:hypothetical protein